jgi:cobalt-zinc-cadmium efflux system outer membrane protein
MKFRLLSVITAAATLGVSSGCSTVPVQSSRQQAQALLQRYAGPLAQFPDNAEAAENELRTLLAAPLDATAAIRVAWLRNADAQAACAQLGISTADVFAASRPANPQLGLAWLWPSQHGGDRKLDGTLGFSLDDLIRLPSRRQYGAVELRVAQQQLAAKLYALALDTLDAWLEAAASQQRLSVRRAIAESAQTAAELAEQYRLAGNINAVETALQAAAGTEAALSLSRSERDASRSRSRLRQVLGLTATDPALQLPTNLPAAEGLTFEAQQLHAEARSQRLDLAAARSEVESVSLRLAATRRFRLLGGSAVSVLGEQEGDSRRTGISAGIELPLFSQGQSAVARATAELQLAEAHVRQLEVSIDAEVDAQLEQLARAYDEYRQYRERLIPQRESIVARLSEQANFMLTGPFELLLARQQSYSAYEGAVDALQSWWQSRVALARALGAPLPTPVRGN